MNFAPIRATRTASDISSEDTRCRDARRLAPRGKITAEAQRTQRKKLGRKEIRRKVEALVELLNEPLLLSPYHK
jgi:hypothetical protein